MSIILIAGSFLYARENKNSPFNDNSLSDIQIFNKDSVIIAGMQGKLLKTLNGGDDWIFQDLPTESRINKIHFTTSRIGWGVGEDGTIIKTVDFGDTWTVLNFEFNDIYFQSVWFNDDQNGWVIGQSGKIYKTSDGGDLWCAQESGVFDHLYSVFFINESTGFIVGGSWSSKSGIILKTTDGGKNWINIFDDWKAPFCDVFFINDSVGWVVGDESIIMKTEDGGNSWKKQESKVWEIFLSVYFLNERDGWIVGSGGLVLETKNSGLDWGINSYRTTCEQFDCIRFSDNKNGWIVGTNGIILKTDNGGKEWLAQNTESKVCDPPGIDVARCTLLNYPNPFNPVTTIRFDLPKEAAVSLKVVDILGRRVRLLVENTMNGGEHAVVWDGRSDDGTEVAAGIYFARLRVGEAARTIKLVLVR